ncbi:MAG: flavodoxin domain-containing protein, partial [Candidatus Heimdallarchaeaceae archaeon]
MKETLIVFGTRYGATEEVAAEIQKILEKEYDQHVEIWNLKDWRACPDLSDFNNVILGSGIE